MSVSRVHRCQKSRSNTVYCHSSTTLTKVVMRPHSWELPRPMLRKCHSGLYISKPDSNCISIINKQLNQYGVTDLSTSLSFYAVWPMNSHDRTGKYMVIQMVQEVSEAVLNPTACIWIFMCWHTLPVPRAGELTSWSHECVKTTEDETLPPVHSSERRRPDPKMKKCLSLSQTLLAPKITCSDTF